MSTPTPMEDYESAAAEFIKGQYQSMIESEVSAQVNLVSSDE